MADLRSGLDPMDYRFINKNPDPDFSPERNKAVVDETIREAEKRKIEELQFQGSEIMNRIDIVGSYARYRFNKGTKDIRNYLGEAQYKAIVGENLLSKLRIAQTTNRLSHNRRLEKGIII